MICRLQLSASDRDKFFPRDRLLSFTSFHCHRAAVFTDEKMLQRCEQIRTQPSFLFANSIKIPALQQQREKTLGQIFGFLCFDAFSPNETINRSPIRAAKFLERLLCR